jgi:hypothetical protein
MTTRASDEGTVRTFTIRVALLSPQGTVTTGHDVGGLRRLAPEEVVALEDRLG